MAEKFFKERQSLNALVVIDEAHRLAPRELPKEDDAARGVRALLRDAARTTRKYGLVSCPGNTLQKITAAFLRTGIQQRTVGRPSLAATTGGHGGPPHLWFLKDISGTQY
jgi:ATPase family associated with various cellular activities (AAA)